MNKKYLSLLSGLFLALVLAGAGCSSTPSETKQNDVSENTQEQQVPEVYTNETKEFTIAASNWKFDPGTIVVKQGDKVKIKITSTDVKHSFMLKDYNINVQLEPNQTQTIEFTADKSGVFQFRCAVPCGAGHKDMIGTLVVK